MTSCISIAANQKSYNSTHTHTPQENQNQGTGRALVSCCRQETDGLLGGEKVEKKSTPKRARENASLPLSLPLSSLHPRLEGRGRLRPWWCLEATSVGSGSRSEWWSSRGVFLNNSPAWFYCTGLSWDTQPAGYLRQDTSQRVRIYFKHSGNNIAIKCCVSD